jgi:2-oxoisovalerate dehydrogenase E1 component beta subunit
VDAYGLMISAIKDPNPVLFLNPKALMRVRGADLIPGEPADEKELKAMIDQPVDDRKASWKPRWPELADFEIPIGVGKITRAGDRATIVSYGRTLPLCNKVADVLSEEGIAVEVIDLRSLYPYDWGMIRDSIRKTGRVLFVNEDTEVTNFGEHLAYRTTSELFYELQARPRVLAGKNVPGIGLHPNLEEASVPHLEDILHEARELLAEVP